MHTTFDNSQPYYHVLPAKVWEGEFKKDKSKVLKIESYDQSKAEEHRGRFMPERGSKHFAETHETALQEASILISNEIQVISHSNMLKRTVTIRAKFQEDRVVCLDLVDEKTKCRDEFMGITGCAPEECLRPKEYANSCSAAEDLDQDGVSRSLPIAGIRWGSLKHPGGYCLSVFDPLGSHTSVDVV